ncbi:MAG: aldo/keto reductase [Actinomycetota bacterium]|nr:aldo/keto reductase [Actinomycetota bacterium]
MTYRRLGRSGLKVSVLSFGSWVTFGPQVSDHLAVDCLAAAYDAGVNFFDNAEVDSGGESERIMGEAIATLGWPRHSYVLSTKLMMGIHDTVNMRNTLNRNYLLSAIDGSLDRLGTDFVDLLFCHRSDPETPEARGRGPTLGPMHATLPLALVGKDLWTGIPIVEKVIRTVAVYLGLVIMLRFAGKRDLAQLNSFDLVVLLLLSNIVQNAVIGNDTSLSGGLLGAAVILVANGLVVRLFGRSDRSARLFEGNPTVIVSDGAFDDRALRRVGLRKADLISAIRRQGADEVGEVDRAVLAPGGAIVVTLKEEAQNPKMSDLQALEGRIDAKLDALLAAVSGPRRP